MTNNEIRNTVASMNNASLKQKLVELELKFEGMQKKIAQLVDEMELCQSEYLIIQQELKKRKAL